MKQVDYLVAFTAWLLIAIVFLGFIPEILGHTAMSPELLWILIVSWILIFYLLELVLHWHHCKDIWEKEVKHTHEHKNSPLLFAGTFAHNVIHGVVLYSAFYIDIYFGITMTIAVLLHAIPQNIANFLMNHKDMKFVYVAAAGWVFGAIILYPFIHFLEYYLYHILAIIWWGLLYTAMSDIFPSFKDKWVLKQKLLYFWLVLAGMLSFVTIEAIGWHEHHHHGHEHHSHDYRDKDMHHHEEHISNHDSHAHHNNDGTCSIDINNQHCMHDISEIWSINNDTSHDEHAHHIHHSEEDHWDMSMREMSTMLEWLSGDMLDKMFLEWMIPHHQAAIDMARYLENSEREELRELWREIIEVQQAEIDMMNNWLQEWNL